MKTLNLALVIWAIALVLSGSAAASDANKLQIIAPTGGQNIAYGGEIVVQYTDSYTKVVENLSVIGDNGQEASRIISVGKKPNKTVQTVIFDTSNNVLLPGKYHTYLKVSRNGKMLDEVTGSVFNVVKITAYPQMKQQWYKGGNYPISWMINPVNSLNYVVISATVGGHDLGVIAKVAASTGTYQWNIPENFGAGYDLSSVVIRVEDSTNPKIFGDSVAISIVDMPPRPLIVTPSNSGPISGNGYITRSFVAENPTTRDILINGISLSCTGNCLALTSKELWFTQEPYDPPTLFFQVQHLDFPVVRPGEKRIIMLQWKYSGVDDFNIVLINLQEQAGDHQYQNVLNLPLPAMK